MKPLQEVTSIRELELHKVIREQEQQIAELQNAVAKYKLGHDGDKSMIQRLEIELFDRDECIYKLNKMCFALQNERRKQETGDMEVYTLRETVDLQQKEIEELKRVRNQASNEVKLKKTA